MRSWTRVLILGLILLFAAGQPTSAQITTPSGALGVSDESTIATYHCAGLVTPAGSPTDIVTLAGSGTKTIHVIQIRVSVESTSAGIADVVILRRSTADTAGTSTTPTIAKLDTNNAAATAVCTQYTGNPTTGTLVANVDTAKQSGTQGLPVIFNYSHNTQSLILRGTTDILAINGNADSLLAGEAWAYTIEWQEY